jgi:GNAT superfamily N-acetyltransferase
MTPVDESNAQFIGAWTRFCTRLPGGTVDDLDGVAAIFGNIPLAFFNVCFLTSPAQDEADLRRRTAAAVRHATATGHPWFMAVCQDWVPAGAEEVLREQGLELALPLTGMAADVLTAPRRPLPTLAYSRVDGQAGSEAIANINSDAYGFPRDLGRYLAVPSLWEGDTFPYLGAPGSENVTCSATIPVDGRLYVGWVATLPDHHGKGYAEAVMRHSLGEAGRSTGLTRTILHATEAGRPLYTAMGYETITRFGLYALVAEQDDAGAHP